MSRLNAILRQGVGLLVDDGRLAAATVVWLVLAWVVLPRLARETDWGGPILFAGLAVILVESAFRRAGLRG
jgi:hypothetical protein